MTQTCLVKHSTCPKPQPLQAAQRLNDDLPCAARIAHRQKGMPGWSGGQSPMSHQWSDTPSGERDAAVLMSSAADCIFWSEYTETPLVNQIQVIALSRPVALRSCSLIATPSVMVCAEEKSYAFAGLTPRGQSDKGGRHLPRTNMSDG